MRYYLFLLLLFSQPALADGHDDFVHLTAHAGASFALQTIFYGVNSRAFSLSPPLAEGIALLETLAVGLLYKGSEGDAGNLTSFTQNMLGSTLAVGTHLVFKF